VEGGKRSVASPGSHQKNGHVGERIANPFHMAYVRT
jgi:hypothetical protein